MKIASIINWLIPWRTLGLRLMIISLLVEIVMLAVLMVSNTAIMEQAIRQQFETRLAELNRLVGASLAQPLVQHDYGMLQDALDALRAPHGIDYLVLMDHRGRVMASSGWQDGRPLPPLTIGGATDSALRYDTAMEIRLGGQIYGELRLGVSTAIFAESRRSLLTSGLVIAAVEVILSATVLISIGFWLTHRLSQVTQASEAIAQGALATRVPTNPRRLDEISRLARSFNSMAETLQLRLEQIASREQRYRVLFDGSPVALLECDFTALNTARAAAAAPEEMSASGMAAVLSQVRVKAVNAAAVMLFEACGHASLIEHLARAPDVPGLSLAALTAFANGKLRAESEGYITTLTGHERRVAFSLSVPPSAAAESQTLLISLIDVTQARLAQAALNERTVALERSNAELEQFASVAAHDLREPLRTVSTYVTLLERNYADQLGEDGREFVGYARNAAKRMNRLVLDLLEFSCVGRSDTLMARHESRDLITQALALLRPAIDESGATISIPANCPEIYGNDSEVVRLFVNLVENAIKYREHSRALRIDITCTRDGDCWRFSVADNGIGIDERFFAKLFRIFQRLHPHDRYEGTGIGLAICKRIVERHGGRIWLTSTPGEGSTFYFTLQTVPHVPPPHSERDQIA